MPVVTKQLLMSGVLATFSTLVTPFAHADTRYLSTFAGTSQTIIGSEDRRFTYGVELGFGRPEPRFNWGGFAGEAILAGYVDASHSGGIDKDFSNTTFAIGALYKARIYTPGRAVRVFGEIGWGVQYASRRTHDLPSRLNSTPVASLGLAWPLPHGGSLLTSVSFLHISNGGTLGEGKHLNRGQNQLFFMVGTSF
jgi:Lipid A 3-O-deacylase (PagL)